MTERQRRATIALVGWCEGLIESGAMPEEHQKKLQSMVDEVIEAYDLISKEELDEEETRN